MYVKDPFSLPFGVSCHLDLVKIIGSTNWCENTSLPLGALCHLDLRKVIVCWLELAGVKEHVSAMRPVGERSCLRVDALVGNRMPLPLGLVPLVLDREQPR